MAKAGPGRLRHRVGECIAREALWEPGHSVAVAVSGGLDSMVLLDVLHELTAWHGGRLTVITVDHGTRPSSSDDAAFVQEFCVARDLPCERARLELGESASELVCREARYDVFERLCVDRVALAHHRDDQAETVLLQLIRGAGTRGLGGMRARRGRYVRPLLQESRLALEEWAAWRTLPWRQDPSNTDHRFLRNRVRHQVLPMLESIRPGSAATLARAADNLAVDSDYLSSVAEQASGGSILRMACRSAHCANYRWRFGVVCWRESHRS